MFEGSVAGGEFGFAGVFGDDDGVGGEGLAAAGAAEEAQGGFVLGFGFVGWVEEEDVDGSGELG